MDKKQTISSRNFSDEKMNDILSTLRQWTSFIKNNEHFSFIKFGDGEFYCMLGEVGANCDSHPYTRELGDKLIDAWYFFNEIGVNSNIYVAEWANHKDNMIVTESDKYQVDLMSKTNVNVKFVNYEILLSNTLTQEKFDFLQSIKNSKNKKIFVGPKRLTGVINFLNVDKFIVVPLTNAFGDYDRIMSQIYEEISDDCIFLFSSGMPSKCFIHKILEKNKNLTCLDFGSGFDSLFYGHTREGQLYTTIVKKYYEDL